MKRLLALTAAAFLALPLTPATASPAGTPGAPSAGDPYFPGQGNGGYDTRHYDLTLDYDPASGRLSGRAAISAQATQALSRFNLDLADTLTVRSVTVDGRPASFTQSGSELVVTPARTLHDRRGFSVVVRYDGTPAHVLDPDGSMDGWIKTGDGVYNANEPQGALTWYPGNHHMTDKATYRFTVTVPADRVAVANGDLVRRTSKGGRATYEWNAREPMASYLATVSIGTFDLTDRRVGRYRVTTAVDPQARGDATGFAERHPPVLDYFGELFGRYPYSSTGGIVDNAPEVGYALETQTRPLYPRVPSESLLAHELAHQWFGDSVTPTLWRDIWLNEGFATYAEWLWADKLGTRTVQAAFDEAYARPADDEFWQTPTADPGGPENLFHDPVYDRGAMTLHALRGATGDAAFFAILRAWAREHRYGNADTAAFISLAERVSGKDLGALFDAWLFKPGKPAL
ncbi:putative metallopeptidase [[Actinomadura] parvosata subsp. kistnae]|uniref:Aminopeptidase N n=1 Tax=[Actinomadura] parvosata subsp. kistnae TaxID=1909395 RepID=A0A1V0A7W0_9ACTN|nr:M1 family metallopeptidase [Nonomuraea sp. ATCC 55076]AQZ66259.1 metallopeptidase [Nonomuraea sp. ATCC 55076]SPL97781.1 putative metallopeptidase [Actinomadura parvosata subsp. kistnae]